MLFDLAAIENLHAAMVPPRLEPPAIERAWDFGAERDARVGAYIAGEEAKSEVWRANLDVWAGSFNNVRGVPRSVRELDVLDRLVRKTRMRARAMEREAESHLKRRMRHQREVAQRDPEAGRSLAGHVQRVHRLGLINVEALRQLAVAIKNYRDEVDYRGKAVFSRDMRDFHPNAETIEAMEEARQGINMQRMSSVADLMAELHAEED